MALQTAIDELIDRCSPAAKQGEERWHKTSG
jgi:hypothetical protein